MKPTTMKNQKIKYINSCLCGGKVRWPIGDKLYCLNCHKIIRKEYIKIQE